MVTDPAATRGPVDWLVGDCCRAGRGKEWIMSTYKVIELIGTSEKSWEEAAKTAVEKAGKSVRDLRIAEVVTLDMKVDNNLVTAYRARIKVSFKYED